MKKLKVMSVFGTRPEAIKMCPLIKELDKYPEIENLVCLTGQHKEMLQQVIDIFGTEVKYNLNIMQPRQSLTTITSNILEKIEPILVNEKPDIVLVHGDTTTSFSVALAAFYQHIPVGHVEAGLRTFDKYSPFPEEMNRTLTGKIAELHFAPTENNRNNLLRENISENIFVTGNTVIDAFHITVRDNYIYKLSQLQKIDTRNKRCILMTAHRRENLGQPLFNICKAARHIAEEFDDVEIIYPVHLNPSVQDTAHKVLDNIERVHLVPPLDVEDMHNLMARSFLVMTDSGGLQEEAPACGVPVLVLRTETERPEAVKAGTVKVVGVEEDNIYKSVKTMLTCPHVYEKMAKAINPYGDGHACKRIAQAIISWHDSKY